MQLAIVADDLTGANDSGVQLALHGLKTVVLFDQDAQNVSKYEGITFDTDSRALDPQQSYNKVKEALEFIKQAGNPHIFKKLDSTLRGNIGAEINAVYDVLAPDFVMVAPGYPKNNRTILNGIHYLNGVPLGETEIANDPKTPVTESSLVEILKQQTHKEIGLLTVDDLAAGEATIASKLAIYKEQGIAYIVVDSTEETHLQEILNYTKPLPFQFSWVGSAGIANYLPEHFEIESVEKKVALPKTKQPTLTVIGSVNKNSRAQLAYLLEQTDTHAIAFKSYTAVSDEQTRTQEITRVYEEAKTHAKNGQDIVIYSTAQAEDIKRAWDVGAERNLTHTEVSNTIVQVMGEICAALLQDQLFCGMSMTGGDTVKQFCLQAGLKGFELVGEIEIGVPHARFLDDSELNVITKAGGFGSPEVFINAINYLKGV